MYGTLGIHWAASVPAFLALACVPFPLVFWRYGAQIRLRCKFAAEAARVLKEMRAENRVIDESEAEDEVRDAERMGRLVKSMSRQSKRSVAGGGAGSKARQGGGVAGPVVEPREEEVMEEKEEVRQRDESEIETPKEEV